MDLQHESVLLFVFWHWHTRKERGSKMSSCLPFFSKSSEIKINQRFTIVTYIIKKCRGVVRNVIIKLTSVVIQSITSERLHLFLTNNQNTLAWWVSDICPFFILLFSCRVYTSLLSSVFKHWIYCHLSLTSRLKDARYRVERRDCRIQGWTVNDYLEN